MNAPLEQMDEMDEMDEIIAYAEETVNNLAKRAKLEKTLAQEMPVRFERNIRAFVKYVPDVAHQFRHYRPVNLQLFCSPSGAANLIDAASGAPLYNEDPVAQCRSQVDRVIEKPQFTSLTFTVDDAPNENFIHTVYLNKIYKLFQDAQEELEPITKVPDHLGSAIVFGIGLGYHLTQLLDDVTIDHLYLCEPNKDWFFASLYTCDWEKVLRIIDKRDGSVFFNLGVGYKEFTVDFINESKDKGAFNAVNALLIQHYPSEDLTKIIDQFRHDFHMVSMGWGFFDDGIISIAHDFANAQAKTPVLVRDAQLPKKWRGAKAFVVANGPSLDSAIEEIKACQDEVIIFSCGSVLPTLLKVGLIPDFHLEVERTKFTYDFLAEFIDHDKMKQINFLTTTVMHPSCTDLFKWTGMGFKPIESATVIACDFMDRNQNYVQLKYCNPVVANTGLAFACYMGFEEIYLFGVDNGYKDPEHHHSKHSLYYNKKGEEKKEIGRMVRSGEIEVDGNFGGKVYSTAFFNTGRYYLEHLLNLFPKATCYNCSDGAKVVNTYPVPVEDVMMDGFNYKQELIDYIKTELYVQRKFTEEEYSNWLAIDMFNEICDRLMSYLDKDLKTRAAYAKALKLQIRYLYSYAKTRYRHLYFILEGSMTYIHSVLRMMLYGFADEEKTVALMKDATVLFNVYMEKAKLKYQRVLDEVDQQDCHLMKLLKEGDEDE